MFKLFMMYSCSPGIGLSGHRHHDVMLTGCRQMTESQTPKKTYLTITVNVVIKKEKQTRDWCNWATVSNKAKVIIVNGSLGVNG